MKNTVLSCLTAAIGAAASASLTAQEPSAPAVVEVVRVQDPRPGVDIELRLKQVIEMLQTEELDAARRDQARRTLEELLERVHKDHARRADAKAGSGGVWIVSPDGEAEGDVAVVEIQGAPRASKRVRIRQGEGEADAPEAETRVLRKRVARLGEAADELRAGPRPPRVPAAPRAPGAGAGPKPPKAKAPKAPNQVEWKVLHGDGGRFHVLDRNGEAIEGSIAVEVEVDGDHHEIVERVLRDEVAGEGLRRSFVKLRSIGADDEDDGEAADHRAKVMQLLRERIDSGDARKAGTIRKMLIEREAAAAEVEARAAKQRKGAVLQLDDVTDEHDLHEMLDEMRSEMREIRELMQKIRSQAKADAKTDAKEGASVGAAMRFMKQ